MTKLHKVGKGTGCAIGLGSIGKGVATEIPNVVSYQRTITIEENQEFIFSNDDTNKHKVGDISGSAIGLGNLKESGDLVRSCNRMKPSK